ncbi:hypothetical protein MMYC01_203949 [Madurella mycetomatis]|uniref:CENP-V/GFA domain-containing protein n=1 Tax=Madurella mycetomatis TaxID=100816 RepID=A0A175WBB7_9PEZI|nr:hypothetical protein MMYC01_203949 [Madurella mycetomatis]
MATTATATAMTQTTHLTLTCHCGRISVRIPSKPTDLNECRCTVCYKYGALWAYYPRGDVVVTASDKAAAVPYVRTDTGAGAQGSIEFMRCSVCGCVTHWLGLGEQYTRPTSNMGVNARMLPEGEIEGMNREVSYC